ncbi:MAG: AraC family transcriptional regulator, partial [Bacteroidota bacterium]
MDQQIINYQRIQQAIEYLSAHVTDQPSLEEVAEQVHLSPFHFQRMFKEWAGISPKKFLQYLTKEYLKSHIIQSPNFLELSEQAGLSSSSRVHDLFSKLEGVTPQEYKSMGEQLTIRYGFHSSPFGACLIGSTKRGICHLVFIEEKNKEEELGKLEDNWPLAKLVEDPDTTVNWCSHIFSTPNDQKQEKPRLSLFVKG